MSESLRSHLSAIRPDEWRRASPFERRFEVAQNEIYSLPKEDVAGALRVWLRANQPCVFGRVAAANDLISFCILDEDEVDSDDQVMDAIQKSRTEWTRRAFRGEKSAFILFIRSRTLAEGEPDQTFESLAQRLCSLYLLTPIASDEIYMDEIFLETADDRRSCWRWNCGVNYFGAHADGRWWQDHRIPGGIAFSVNSVGHMVKAGLLAREGLLEPAPQTIRRPVTSLPMALELAMRTIANASEASSGRATWLKPMAEDHASDSCPVDLPKDLANKDFCEYGGWYHTDYTVPSDYFTAAEHRPPSVPVRDLDFTYLFQENVDNPDFITTAAGRQIRVDHLEELASKPNKAQRSVATLSQIQNHRRLAAALEG